MSCFSKEGLTRTARWLMVIGILGCATVQATEIAHWPLDNSTTDVIGGYNGTLQNAAGYSASVAPICPTVNPAFTGVMLHGGAANVASLQVSSASGQCMTVADAAALDMGSDKSFTIEAWVKLNVAPDGLTKQWLAQKKAVAADDETDYAVLVVSGDIAASALNKWGKQGSYNGNELVLLFGRGAGNGYDVVVSNKQIADTNWHLITVSYNADTGEVIFMLDLDGDRVTGVNPANSANNGDLIIGSHINASGVYDQGIDGLIDEVWLNDKALDGAPHKSGLPPGKKVDWYWTWEGSTWPDGVYNIVGNRPWRVRFNRFSGSTPNGCFLNAGSLGGGNDGMRIYDAHPDSNYLFWDQSQYGGSKNDAAPRWDPLNPPPRCSRGATLVYRFKADNYKNFSTDPNRRHKFIRIDHILKDAPLVTKTTGGGSTNVILRTKLHHNLAHSPPGAINGQGTDIVLMQENLNVDTDSNGVYDARWYKVLTPGTWYTVHMIHYIDPADLTKVHLKTWVKEDGGGWNLEEDWWMDVPGDDGNYLPHNDNGKSQLADTTLDYIRFSSDAAWDPDGNVLTPTPEICDNGEDDDADGNADCADSECQRTDVCCPHNPAYDVDDDGDVDADDFAAFQRCLDPGAGFDALSQECKCMDRHPNYAGDGDIDMDDLDVLIGCAGGPGVGPVDPACDGTVVY